jgi:hypothetical protein
MNFSIAQWSIVVIGDLILRALSYFAFLIPIFALFSFRVSVLHLTVLAITNIAVLGLRWRFALPIVLAITNVIFVAIFVWSWVYDIKSGHQSSCVGYDSQCSWINGTITELGVQAIVKWTVVEVAVNIVSVLIAASVDVLRSERAS